MLHIIVKTIPHKLQRYDTLGDYWEAAGGKVEFRISNCESTYYEAAIFLHEFVEYFLCRMHGVDPLDIDRFDMDYEKNRSPTDTTSQPGDDPKAPYRTEHRFAENLERLFIHELGLNWNIYDKETNDISVKSWPSSSIDDSNTDTNTKR